MDDPAGPPPIIATSKSVFVVPNDSPLFDCVIDYERFPRFCDNVEIELRKQEVFEPSSDRSSA